MNAVFTIVAKNYLPMARTLGDSIRELHPTLSFHILLSDEPDNTVQVDTERYLVTAARDIGIQKYRHLAFKYNLVELSTALKPFFFEYLFNNFGYDKIIYLDPDIYVYGGLQPIFDDLDRYFLVLTPHVTKLDIIDVGSKAEGEFLLCGTYNLGFAAIKNNEKGRDLLEWWKVRLYDKGFVDRMDGLFVDQKWMDLVPSFDDEVLVSRYPGYNVAHWNLHQRRITYCDGKYYASGQLLVFFHFSGFDPSQPDKVTKSSDASRFNLSEMPELRELFRQYAERVVQNSEGLFNSPYAYSTFDNGVAIFSYQRRLFRRLMENGYDFGDPFRTSPDSFYELLKQNKMLVFNKDSPGEFRKKDIGSASKRLKAIQIGLRRLKQLIGVKNFHLLMRVMASLSRPEEQTYLLESLDLDLPIRFYQ
jgi:hypothetical protein